MLQWMGGSRRKVATSRKSLQKKQKQYFEQRRRQQQHQQHLAAANGLEGSEGNGSKWDNTHNKDHHHSLDILNLLNFSTSRHPDTTAANYPTTSSSEDPKVNGTARYHVAMDAPIGQASTVIPVDSVGIEKASSQSDCQVETLSPDRVLLGSLDNHSNSFYGVDNKPDLCNVATQQRVSVFELLGDDESNEYLEEVPTHEAHVAFSVDGLGKVETETPPQSPHQPDSYITSNLVPNNRPMQNAEFPSAFSPMLFQKQYMSYVCFSPSKSTRQLNSSRNSSRALNDLELEVDAIMQDLEIPLSGSSLEFSAGIENSYSKLKKNLSAVRDPMQLDSQGSKVRSSLSHGQAAFCNTRNNYEDLWDARSSSLVGDFLDQRHCGMPWKSWSCHSDGDFSEFLKYGKPNYAFGGPHPMKKRDATKTTERFNLLDSPPKKHQKSEIDYDFIISKGPRHHSEVGLNFEDIIGQPDWSSFVLEDSRESQSLRSEESCSSTAVRGEASNSFLASHNQ